MPSNKGKAVDKSTPWSEWCWDTRGYYYSSRHGPTGVREYSYRYPELTTTQQQQQQTPRTPGENFVLSTGSATPLSSSGPSGDSYASREASYSGAARTNSSTETSGASSYQNPPTSKYGLDSYYTTTSTSVTQPSGSTASNTSYSSNHGSLNPYEPSVTTAKLEYATSSKTYDAVNSAFRGMSLNSPSSTVHEQGYTVSSSVQTPYQPQSPSNYIARDPNSPDKERLDPRYHCIGEKEQRKFWKVGRVFMMLWTEPAAEGSTRNGTHYSKTKAFTVRYVALLSSKKATETASARTSISMTYKRRKLMTCDSPIHTYNGQATLKPNLPERQQHAIIYTSRDCPPERFNELTDGTIVKENLSKDPIRVRSEQKDIEGDLGACSRLNYSKIYTVEHYIRVLNIGMVESNWIPSLTANSYVTSSTTPVEKPTKLPSNTTSGTRDRDKRSRGKDKDGKRSRH
ncbi:hypothetical protein LHYA1_G000398 [Lachnellula hyalina]|uniref:DUF6590 domain-containing protein n=1 Tax=Lachnellula hyalina TaxID=1316788 RepID=A0A8H8U1S6_9HELO|nr:uncharacterized protein LHYA1_G000398 [Lachnellula hyalina]TVY30732.1 hypothetical protein LHYA1_G000398 [Lachnellula hyalina]